MSRSYPSVDDATMLFDTDVMAALASAIRVGLAPLPAAARAASTTKPYSADRLAFNFKPANTRRLRAGLARSKAGTGLVRLGMLGDSTSAGYPGDPAKAAPTVMRELLAADGYPTAGTGPVIANPGGAPGAYLDPRYTTTGTWTSQAANPNHIRQSSVVGSTITFTSDKPGTVLEFSYLGLGAAFRYSVDGSAAVAVSEASSGALQRKTVTGLADTPHSVTITVDAVPAGGAFYLSWVDVRRTTGILVGNFGTNSTTTANWTSGEFYYPRQTLREWAPDVVFIDLGINDWGSSATPEVAVADFEARTQSLVDTFSPSADVILVTSNPFEGKDYLPYNAAKYRIAQRNDIPLIDVYESFESYSIGQPLGLFADAAHPSAAGYAQKGAVLANAVR